ncbi:hypothetical protein [Alkalihalophilus marmarensis]|uniref:Uncharacterized protein n=1 Tax=Alkalihalophilus marmarensis DSM 21297 TaxID=1188261 RepID=U6SQG9_9BACI|nr:hypothetical protein [Alkalihalophilus marmarensis]ERN53833.1 hypothetical protein A33I_10155 [Alkalihalophilus marmarensis DSM 21297]
MQKRIVVLSMVAILGLVSYFTVRFMNSEATALNDSFTKEFIVEEYVEEDFHLFESKTGQYRMLFPNEFQMISEPPEFYGRQGTHYEHWFGTILKETTNGISPSLKVTYKDEEVDLTEIKLNSMLNNHAYKDNYETINLSETTIYYGSSSLIFEGTKAIITDPKVNQANTYFGLISDNNSNKSVEFYYSLDCIDKERGCEINSDLEHDIILKIIRSTEFQ